MQRLSSIITKPKASIITILLLLLICMFSLVIFHHTSNSNRKQIDDYDHFHNLFLATGSNTTLATYLRDLTLRPHLAGTKEARGTTDYVKREFVKVGLETEVVEYEVLLSYPKEVRLEVLGVGNGSVRLLEVVEC